MQAETYAALVAVATTLVGTQGTLPTREIFCSVNQWQELAEQAEIHGLSVMLGRLAATQDIGIPRELDLQLKALTIRHQKVLAARKHVLAEVIDCFDAHSIRFAFLKGAALAQLIYDPAWLRPMRDIDILVSGADAALAQKLLREIGFENEDSKDGYLFEHHHLPNSTRKQDGFTISLEIHHDALSGDVDASITLDNLNEPLRAFAFADKTAYAFGHEDMLKHLCFHSFEPAETIKLGSMVDMIRYADHYADEIDWQALEKSQPNISNALRCIHALIPLPEKLRSYITPLAPAGWKVAGLGKGFIPLTQISRLDRKQQLVALLVPSAWWTHIFYVIPPEKSRLTTRLFRHPFMLLKWLFRRYRAAHRSKTA